MSEKSSTPPPKINIKETLKVFIFILHQFYKNAPLSVVTLFILRFILSAKSLIYSLLFAKTIDIAIKIANSDSKDLDSIYPYIGAIFTYYVVADFVLNSFLSSHKFKLRTISRTLFDQIIFEKINKLGVQTVEDPEVVDIINRASRWSATTFDFFQMVVDSLASLVQAIFISIAVATFAPQFIPVVIVASILSSIPSTYFNKMDFKWFFDHTEERRKVFNSFRLLSNPPQMQEVSITGAYKYISERAISFSKYYDTGRIHIHKKRVASDAVFSLFDSTITAVGFWLIIRSFIKGAISAGDMTFQIKSLGDLSYAYVNIISQYSYIQDYAVNIQDIATLFNLQPAVKDGEIEMPRLQTPPEIKFVDVSFKYPNSEKYVFENLNLTFNSGEQVAIVGHNGAGKTTIVKLIARIYTPTSGKILINGVNLNEYKIDDWYKNIGILFQDYNFYSHLTVEENIYLGRSIKELDQDRVVEAAKNADAHDFIMEYPNQYQTVMSEQFKGGIRPSTGQQQKIAIARFFYRDAPLAIFDEPTAAIDAVSEYNIFNKIYDFFSRKTVIIISHRFSTVRNADRIIVMSHGKAIEEGTHNQLMELNGEYAKAYKLQAEGYKE